MVPFLSTVAGISTHSNVSSELYRISGCRLGRGLFGVHGH